MKGQNWRDVNGILTKKVDEDLSLTVRYDSEFGYWEAKVLLVEDSIQEERCESKQEAQEMAERLLRLHQAGRI